MEAWARKTRGINRRGTRAVQPLATAVLTGTQYFVTDEFKIERSNGTIWESSASIGAPAGATTQVQFNNAGILAGDPDLTFDGNTLVTKLLTVNEGAVINESGADSDTRIEGDTEPNLFFIDASTDRIGMGTNVPAAVRLHVLAVGNEVARFERAGATNPYIQLNNGSATIAAVIGISNTNSNAFFGTLTSHEMGFRTNNLDKLAITVAGVFKLNNCITPPSSSPASMGQLYVEAGVLKYRGSGGTVTVLAVA